MFRGPILLDTRSGQCQVVQHVRAWESFLKVTDWYSGFESVGKYLGHFKRKIRSEGTRELSCDVLMRFCKFAGKNPDELVRLSPSEASKLVQDYVDSLADKGQSIRTVNVALTFLRTFFRFNGFKGGREIEVDRFFQPSRYRKRTEYIPAADEIFRMAYAAGSAKNKAMVLCLYTSGLRNSTLRALCYRDVSAELEKYEVVEVPVYPEMKQVDPRACKGNIPYYTFFSKETVVTLKEYLNERRSLSGDIAPDEPLFASTSSNVPTEVRRKTRAKRNTLDLVVKRAAKKGGVERWREVHPHCLRKAFESALRNGGLDVKDQEFLMGHILPGTQDTYYDKTKINYLRRKYAKVTFFPERTHSDEASRKRQILDTVKLLGFSEDKIKKVEEALAKYERVDEALDEIKKIKTDAEQGDRENARQKVNDDKTGRSERRISIVRGERGLVKSLKEGWDLVKELSDDRFMLRRID